MRPWRCFWADFALRVIYWARSPVPFKIPTTCGQGASLEWIKQDKLECPMNTSQVFARMFLEIFLFRSLWRNTKATVYDGPKLTYESSKWLWLFGIMFHYSFLIIVIRHMRLFMDPIPFAVSFTRKPLMHCCRSAPPTMYMTDVTIVLALLFLFGRRLTNPPCPLHFPGQRLFSSVSASRCCSNGNPDAFFPAYRR